MKFIVRTIIVLAFLGFVIGSSALAQGGAVEAHVESGAETIGAAVSAPSAAPPPPPGLSFTPAADEPSVGVVDKLVATSVAGDPATYINFMSGAPTSSNKVLVIPNTEIKTEDVAAITQDMQVMSHIFDKIFKGPRLIEGVFVNYGDFFGRSSRATQVVYIQGYGTLFLMEVDFPFTPPGESKEKPEDTKEGDSVWNQAAQEMFFPTATTTGTGVSAERYDAEKVEELKSRLIKALKHTANIRNLKSDEWIILTVIGQSHSYGGGMYGGGGGGGMYGGGGGMYGGGGGMYGGGGGMYGGGAANVMYSRTGRRGYATTRIVPGGVSVPSSTVLTIRAKKSDVDTFAKGDLDYDEFREKVQVLTYSSLGQTVGRRLRITGQRTGLPPSSGFVAPEEPTKDSLF